MIRLEKFTESDFETLISWIKSKEELNQFAGPIFSFPLTKKQLINYINMMDKQPFKIVLTETNKTIGHCELNYENGNRRLSRILIGEKSARGKGYCKIIISKMTELFFKNPAVKEIDLNVYDWNKGAIRCYENVGFKIVPKNFNQHEVNEKIWTSLNMKLDRNEWIENQKSN